MTPIVPFARGVSRFGTPIVCRMMRRAKAVPVRSASVRTLLRSFGWQANSIA